MRKILIILTCCIVPLLLGYTAYRGYRVWKEKHWMSLAREFSAKSDPRNTQLCLQQVLRFNQGNVEANRMMADLTEKAREPSALIWRHRVVELNPRSTDDRLALAKTALVFRDYAGATNALAALGSEAKQSYEYHHLAGLVAVAVGQLPEADAHFREAARLEPWNSIPQLNLSGVRLLSTNTLDQAEARIGLRRVSQTSTNLDLRCLALRELMRDADRANDSTKALVYSAELLSYTNSTFEDRLNRLVILRKVKSKEFTSTLTEYQREAASEPAKVTALARWQLVTVGPREAMSWLQSLPVQTQTNIGVAWVMADCLTLQQSWPELQKMLEKQDWQQLECLRHAFLSRSLRGQNLAAAAQAEWGLAMQSAAGQKGRLAELLKMAAVWKWRNEAEEILWAIVNRYPEEQTAFDALARRLHEKGSTRSLMSLFNTQSKRRPADLSVKNNLAMTALLLNAPEVKPHELAREVYEKAPTNAAYASTYAFSLHLQRRDAEAMQVFRQLPPKALEDPSIAGYYGLLLKAAGETGKAKVYLDWASKIPLLPEEKKLFEVASSSKASTN